jgi:hypothetical protein
MRQRKPVLPKMRFSILAIVLLCSTFLVVSVSLSEKPTQNDIQQRLANLIETTDVDNIKLRNYTSAFNVVGKEKVPHGDIRLTLQNDYDKKITAYEISIGSTTSLVDTILSTHEDGIMPGFTRQQLLPINIDPDLESKGIIILAVVFEDGSGDGHPDFIKEINDYRRGETMQMERVSRLLGKSLSASDGDLVSALDSVQANMLSAPGESDNSSPMFFNFGISDTQKRISSYIENIKQKPEKEIRGKLIELINYSNYKSSELKGYLEKVKTNNL